MQWSITQFAPVFTVLQTGRGAGNTSRLSSLYSQDIGIIFFFCKFYIYHMYIKMFISKLLVAQTFKWKVAAISFPFHLANKGSSVSFRDVATVFHTIKKNRTKNVIEIVWLLWKIVIMLLLLLLLLASVVTVIYCFCEIHELWWLV